MADALNLCLNLGKLNAFDSGSPSFTNFTIDGTTDECAFAFSAEDPITITRVGFRVNAVTGTPGTLTISLQALGPTTGEPDGTILGGGSPASVAVNAATLTAGQFNWVTLNNSYTCTRAQDLAIKLDPTAGTWDASNSIAVSLAVAGWNQRSGIPYPLQAPSGTYARVSGYPIYGYGSTTRVYGYPYETITNTSYDSGTTPDELGICFTLPAAWGATYKVKGCRVIIGKPASSGQTLIMTLYDSDGTTALQTVTRDSEFFGTTTGGSGYRLCEWFFDESSLSTLNFGTEYFLCFAPQTASGDINIPDFGLRQAADMQAFPLGENCFLVSKTDGAAPADLATRRLYIELFLDDITEPSGGAGGIMTHPGMSGGMRG